MELKIAKIISSGEGIGWADGKTFFVPYVIPGEVIFAEEFHKEKSFYRVDKYSIKTEAKDRSKPVCSLFTQCGGCHFQHIPYKNQLDIKKQIFGDHFNQQRVESLNVDHFYSVSEYGDRSRAKVHISNGKSFFRKRLSHDFVRFEKCPLLDEGLNLAIKKFAAGKNGSTDIQFEYSKATGKYIPEEKLLVKRVKERDFHISKGSFFQSSENSAELLVNLLIDVIKEKKIEKMTDLFSGVGLFSAFAEDLGVSVCAYESSSSAVKNFQKNCRQSKIFQEDIYKMKSLGDSDLFVADPPRNGLTKAVVNLIGASSAKHLAYISCNPSTFVRDYALLKGFGFQSEMVFLLDLFPNTNHFEVLSLISR